jgi:hypothetical protein
MTALILATVSAASPLLSEIGVATLWLGYDREWTTLRWVAAVFADLAVLALLVRAVATPPRDAPSRVVGVQLLLLVAYLGSIAIRTLVRRRDVIAFEAVQTGAMLLAGLAGTLFLVHRTGAGTWVFGPALLALAAACYLVGSADRWEGRRANYFFYTSLALVFALTGGELILDGTPLAMLWVSLALLTAAVGRRSRHATLTLHSLVYVVAASMWTGLSAAVVDGLVAAVDHPWTRLDASAWAALAALGACSALAARATAGSAAGLLRQTLAFVVTVSASGVAVVLGRSLLPPAPALPLEPAIVATLRTGVVAAAAIAVAWAGRHAAAREFGALLYPALVWGGLKLLVEDVRVSPPFLLVMAFAFYGGALILGPRLGKMPPVGQTRLGQRSRTGDVG